MGREVPCTARGAITRPLLVLGIAGIADEAHTVIGAAVPPAVSLATIPTAVASTTVKVPKARPYPTVRWMVVKNGFFAPGPVVAVAVPWQRFTGSITLALPIAVVILGLVPGRAAGTVNALTIRAAMGRTV